MAPRPNRAGPDRGTTKATTAVLTGVAGVLCGILVFVIVLNVIGSGADKPDSAAATFDVGPADKRARTIAKGGPILFQDLLGNTRDIYVQHLGDDDWRAFEAHAPGAPRTCFLQWQASTHEFVDACTNQAFPADGTGLTTYPAHVDTRNHVVIDLRQPAPATTTTSTTITTTTTTTTIEQAAG